MMGTRCCSTKNKIILLLFVILILGTLIYYNSAYVLFPTQFSVVRLPPSVNQSEKENDPLWWRHVVCKGRDIKPAGIPDVPVQQLFREVMPQKNNNVFLMDTACNPSPKYRVWCSVESWAKQNPDRQVWFLLTSGKLQGNGYLPETLMKSYSNLNMVTADLNDMFEDTPLKPLFQSRKWEYTWPIELLSDMLRVLVLWWWGGVYSDTDVISIRSLTLPHNSLGFEHPKQIGSAFYSFTARHPALHDLMEDMYYNFKASAWGSIGPQAITRVMVKLCGKPADELCKLAPVTCTGNITIHSRSTFYPILYSEFKDYFKPGGGNNFTKQFENTYALHFWNKMSKEEEVKVNESSVYEVAAKNYCPITYRIATQYSGYF